MNWDDLRYVLALSRAGSLAKAARSLKVDHTTVGRRIEALEADLGLRLFTRTTTGYVVTPEAEQLMPELEHVESSIFQLERCATARDGRIEGVIRVTSPETFGGCYLAPKLAKLRMSHPALTVELLVGPTVFDLARQEADVAVRFFRSKHENLIVQKAGEVGIGLYGTPEYFARTSFPKKPSDLDDHGILTADFSPTDDEVKWLNRLAPRARVVFVSNLTFAVSAAALAGAGIAILPRYLGDAEKGLQRVPMPDEPRQAIWLTVHKDLQHTRRVRLVLDFLRDALKEDKDMLGGK